MDGDGSDSSSLGRDLVLGEMGFGLIQELAGRVGTTSSGKSDVGPAGKRGGGHEGRTQAEEQGETSCKQHIVRSLNGRGELRLVAED